MPFWLWGLMATVFSQAVLEVEGYAFYRDRVPNGHHVACWDGAEGCDGDICSGLGHKNCAGGTLPLNAFGLNWREADFEWTPELCRMDSDGDNLTNGEELGDPCCEWVQSAGEAPRMSPSTNFTPSHPGFKTSRQADYSRPLCPEDIAPTKGRLSGWREGEVQRNATFSIDHFELPPLETTYRNFRFNFDDESAEVFHIVMGIALVDQPRHLHHFVLTGCSEKIPAEEQGKPRWSNDCDTQLAGFSGWAPGAVMFDQPTDVGVPIGRGVGIVGINLNVHYTDADKVSGRVIASDGLQLFYTPTLRPNVAWGTQVIALGGHGDILIPPGEERFFIARTCTVIDAEAWDEGCFESHADAMGIAARLGLRATGCQDVRHLCSEGEALGSLIARTCPRTCGLCGEEEEEDLPNLPGYRYVIDGYCCAEGNANAHYLINTDDPPQTGNLRGCADLCTSRADCAGFASVGGSCYWAAAYPELAPVVHSSSVKFYVKNSTRMRVTSLLGRCDEHNWMHERQDVAVCDECQVLFRRPGSCSHICESYGRSCIAASQALTGCDQSGWRTMNCTEEPAWDLEVDYWENRVCHCSEDIIDEQLANLTASRWAESEPLGERPMVSVFYHAHLLGHQMYQFRLRDGVTTDLGSQSHWDFDAQVTYPLAPNTTLRSGDVLVGACIFDSRARDTFTKLGRSTYDEMCYVMNSVVYSTETRSRFYCEGGQGWTGSLSHHEGVQDLLANHPWQQGQQIFWGESGGEFHEESGPCLFIALDRRDCQVTEQWRSERCDGFLLGESKCREARLRHVDTACGSDGCKVSVSGVFGLSCRAYCNSHGLTCVSGWVPNDTEDCQVEGLEEGCENAAGEEGRLICECGGERQPRPTERPILNIPSSQKCREWLDSYESCMERASCHLHEEWPAEAGKLQWLRDEMKKKTCVSVPAHLTQRFPPRSPGVCGA